MNIPKLLLRSHENKNPKLLMQCLMKTITRTLHFKAILLLNTFFTVAMIRSIVQYTNDCIQPVLERFSDLLKKSDKYPYAKLVYQIDIEAFISTLYLRSAFRLNLQSKETIWNHVKAPMMFL